MKHAPRALLLMLFLAVLSCQPTITLAAAQTGTIGFKVRDNTTGYAVPASVEITPISAGEPVQSPMMTDDAGRLEIALAPGDYKFRFSAVGHQPLETHYEIKAGEKLGFNKVHLDRESPPEEERPEVINRELRSSYVLLYGYVADSDTGLPLPNVDVRLRKIGKQTTTNMRGYFSFSVKVPEAPADQPKIFMGAVLDDLSFELPGYKTLELDGVDFYPTVDAAPFQADLERGTGVERQDVAPTPFKSSSDLPPSHGTVP